MRKVATLLTLILIQSTATTAYARPYCRHCHRHRWVQVVPSHHRATYYAAPLGDMPGGYMPSAGELSGNTGGYAHPEGAGTTSAP